MRLRKLLCTVLCVVIATCFMPMTAFGLTGISSDNTKIQFDSNSGMDSISLSVTGEALKKSYATAFKNYKAGAMTFATGSKSVKYTTKSASNGKISATGNGETLNSILYTVGKKWNKTVSSQNQGEKRDLKTGYLKYTGTTTATMYIPKGSIVAARNTTSTLVGNYDLFIYFSGINSKAFTGGGTTKLGSLTSEKYALLMNNFLLSASGKTTPKVTFTYKYTTSYRNYLASLVNNTTLTLKGTPYTSKHQVKLVATKGGKKSALSGYLFYTSTKSSSYGTSVKSTSSTYYKKSLTKGKYYYFRVKGYRVIDGHYYYTPISKQIKVKAL